MTGIDTLLNQFVGVHQGAGNLSLYDRCTAHQLLCKVCPGCFAVIKTNLLAMML